MWLEKLSLASKKNDPLAKMAKTNVELELWQMDTCALMLSEG